MILRMLQECCRNVAGIVHPLCLEAVPPPASGVPRVMVLVAALWVAASPLTEAQDPQQNTESQEI